MKRGTFIYYAVVGTALVAVPSLRCNNNNLPILEKPQLLSQICDVNTIIAIGKSYRKIFPDNSRQQLMDTLLAGTDGKKISANLSNSSISYLLDQKVKDDFKSGRVVVIKGWVLSQTEARQCALFSLS